MLPMNNASAPPQDAPQQPQAQPVDKSMVEAQLLKLLAKAKQIAEQNGVNFSELVSKVQGMGSPTRPPMPPSSPAPPFP